LPYIISKGPDIQDIERKQFHILKVLEDCNGAMGSKLIARRLRNIGIELDEVTVRHYLKMTDERGLTHLVKRHEGRAITEQGRNELKRALVSDKVGFVIDKIENLSFRTDFDFKSRRGSVPVNISFFQNHLFGRALDAMKTVFEKGLCVSDLVCVAEAGQRIGEHVVPEGMTGLATVCGIVINAALLHANIPINSKFGGVLQIREGRPLRFIELIYYSGSSLDPSEIFIRAGMTSVNQVRISGNGEVLANYREIPGACLQLTREIIAKLQDAGIGGVFLIGGISEPVCQVPVDVNRVGVVLIGGLNPVAAAHETGIESENHAMSTLVDYQDLIHFTRVYEERNSIPSLKNR
jgi:repressor of nif and glnA expression